MPSFPSRIAASFLLTPLLAGGVSLGGLTAVSEGPSVAVPDLRTASIRTRGGRTGQRFDGKPGHPTFSLCAIDPHTGESGVVIATREPNVGGTLTWVRAGVGAVVTQSRAAADQVERGLDLLERGIRPERVVHRLLAADGGRELHQIGIIDMQGNSAFHASRAGGGWAGGRSGANYTVQGNLLLGPSVVDAVAEHFESTEGTGTPLAERMLLALEAGQRQAADRHWGLFRSAALRIADPHDRGPGSDRASLAIDVGMHESPVAEMKRLYDTEYRGAFGRAPADIGGDEVVRLKRMLHALGYWGQDLEKFPEPPQFDLDRELLRGDPPGFQAARDRHRKAANVYMGTFGLFDAETVSAVDAFRRHRGLDDPGNPPGLVDRRFVEALEKAYAETPGARHRP